jgi:hypothetical protein
VVQHVTGSSVVTMKTKDGRVHEINMKAPFAKISLIDTLERELDCKLPKLEETGVCK